MKRILLSNDDGVYAPGLNWLHGALSDSACLDVVAPDRDHSGASHSLTLTRPLRARELDNGFISVDGTPTDCVHIAITGLLEHEPDMVISGINSGSNLGDDVLYSGTVAAAMEGRFLGYPAIAVSLVGHASEHFAAAAEVVKVLVQHLREHPLPPDTILNINVPDRSFEAIKGFQVTRLGHRHRAEPVEVQTDPRGQRIYWVGMAGPEQDAGAGTDFYAVNQGYVSVTPLQTDLTHHNQLSGLQAWAERLSL